MTMMTICLVNYSLTNEHVENVHQQSILQNVAKHTNIALHDSQDDNDVGGNKYLEHDYFFSHTISLGILKQAPNNWGRVGGNLQF